MNTIIIKAALPKSAFNPSLISSFLPNQHFLTFYTREYNLGASKDFDYLYTKYTNYVHAHVTKKLLHLLETSNFFCEAAGEQSYFWITKLNNTISFSVAMAENDFILNQSNIEYTLNLLFEKEKAIAAYICNINDTWWLSDVSEQPSLFTYRRLQHSRYNNCDHTSDILHKNFLADEIWRPLCWKFWINTSELQQYSNLLHYPHLLLSIKLAKHSYQFQLYHSLNDFVLYSRDIVLQLLYNEHSLHTTPDATCDIIQEEAILKLIQYWDQNNNPTSKEQAVYQEVTTYLMTNNSTGHLLSRKKYIVAK